MVVLVLVVLVVVVGGSPMQFVSNTSHSSVPSNGGSWHGQLLAQRFLSDTHAPLSQDHLHPPSHGARVVEVVVDDGSAVVGGVLVVVGGARQLVVAVRPQEYPHASPGPGIDGAGQRQTTVLLVSQSSRVLTH